MESVDVHAHTDRRRLSNTHCPQQHENQRLHRKPNPASQIHKFEVMGAYDAEPRYRELCQELASEAITVVDATDGSIPARELACKPLQDLGKRTSDRNSQGLC